MKINKYFVYKDGSINSDVELETFDLEEAIEYAKENECEFVEKLTWKSEQSYNNCEPADTFTRLL